ncbi:ROK family transcriptional regulator [Streptomyces sp. NBC_00878]|uniref:ROK family transcriptional regulator n=1 Tax=Streptomyces sp. NBC_00878 TaxID=2975854 RepID=UPI00224D361C|nr:ROK family transcriptional regulator [Streptomyces sp. NBC_00878]MCX4906576.1 ROK family transcriptional regulator [Streptomyces sp. NBC_00878]
MGDQSVAGAGPGVGHGWNRQRLRSNNEWLLLERIRTAGPLSRAQLARETGLSKPTVSAALAALEQAGLVCEAGQFIPERGRISVLYEADPSAGHVLGVDIGRARLRVAVADLSGRVVARRDVPNRGRTANAVADAVVEAARGAVAEAGLIPSEIVHTVIGTPGVWDEQRRSVRYAPKLPGWSRPGLLDRIAEGLETAITVGNDANLAALGEYSFGAGEGSQVLAYLLIGTGLGVGVVKDGELLPGAHGAAGEIGFLPLPLPATLSGGADDAPRATLEDAVSADAVVRSALAHGMTGPLTAREVFDAARAGVPAAEAAVLREAELLAYAVAVVSAVLDPDTVVVGGGVGLSADLLLGPLDQALKKFSPVHPRLVRSRLGEEAVLLGAVATALETARPEVFGRRSAAIA